MTTEGDSDEKRGWPHSHPFVMSAAVAAVPIVATPATAPLRCQIVARGCSVGEGASPTATAPPESLSTAQVSEPCEGDEGHVCDEIRRVENCDACCRQWWGNSGNVAGYCFRGGQECVGSPAPH